MRNLAGTTTFLLLSFSLPLTGQAAQPAAHDACPGEPGSDFCQFYHRYVFRERARRKIVDAAREAGMEDPSGELTLRRDSTGKLAMEEKWKLKLPKSVEARLGALVTPLVTDRCQEPASDVTLNLDIEGPAPLPHPDSTDRRPEMVNRFTLRSLVSDLESDPSVSDDLSGEKVTAVFFIFVDAAGNVRNVRVQESTGHRFADAKIAQVLEAARFKPARQYGAPMGVWIGQPVTLDFRR